MNFEIPLSYNPVKADSFQAILQRYEGKHHNQIIHDFEQKLSVITGSPYVVALSSGTAAIHLGLKALGVGAGDEVLVSSFTYVATVNPVLYLGATPVFIDSERDTWNMEPALLEKAIVDRITHGKKPKVILVVHIYGMPAKMEEIMAIAGRYEIPVLEDAAEALGATYRGRHVGTFGEIGIVSFNNNKVVTTYGGGALFTSKAETADKVFYWATQARHNVPYYHHTEIGFNYRMGPLNAASGLSQVDELQDRIRRKKEAFQYYCEALEPRGWAFPKEFPGFLSSRWLTTTIAPPNIDVSSVREAMARQRIELRLLWKPMHSQPVFQHFPSYRNGVADALFSTGLSFPSLDNSVAEKVSKIVTTTF
jgi:dTDP-4-amino-4,6-dideoxygalactose transaminase